MIILALLPLISDIIGPTAFAPVKIDINGNIKVVRNFEVVGNYYLYIIYRSNFSIC